MINLVKHAKKLWNFHCLPTQTQTADFIFVACSSQLETVDTTVSLYQQGFAKKILFSGGFGYRSKSIFLKPEADYFTKLAIAKGVKAKDILIENSSTNLLDNINKSQILIKHNFPQAKTALAVSNPWVSRRFIAHLEIKIPSIKFFSCTPQYGFEYFYQKMGEDLVDILVKDINNIIKYGGTDLTKQFISSSVTSSLNILTKYGFPKKYTQP